MAVSKRLRFEIFRRDNHTCRYCGRAAPEVKLRPDHVVPVALGGTDEPSNLVTSCDDCNSGKSSVAPDSAVVAQVADDAMRWARAQCAAAAEMLAEHRGHKDTLAQFEKRWEYWSNIRRRNAWLSPDWEHSVQSWLEAGLPIEIVLDSLDKAMRKDSLRPSDVFKYTCGIAWARVRELREATATRVGPYLSQQPQGGDSDVDFMKGWNAGTDELSELIFEYFSPERVDKFIATGRESAEADGDEINHDGPAREDPYLMRLGAVQAVAETLGDLEALEHSVESLFNMLPGDILAAVDAQCRKDFARWDEKPSRADRMQWAVTVLGFHVRGKEIKGAGN